MRNNIITAVFFWAITVSFLFAPVKEVTADGAYGAPSCIPVYGGGVECPREGNILIDKKVLNPRTGIYVDNILPPDPIRYTPQEIITFQLNVKNSGDKTLDKVTVKDTIPSFVDYSSMSGPASDINYDTNSRVLSFTTRDVAGGQTQVFYVKGRIAHQSALPVEKQLVCPVNVVTAETGGQNPDRDESQFCIEKKAVVPTVPKAGPEHWIFAVLGSSLISGLLLRKKAFGFR